MRKSYAVGVFCLFAASLFASATNTEIGFEPNRGQSTASVKFTAHGKGYALLLERDNIQLRAGASALRIAFAGASASDLRGEALEGAVSHYLIGNDATQWHTNIPNYGRVRYTSVYPGVDLIVYGKDGLLEYDLEVAPGADASQIRMDIAGHRTMRVDARGDLVITMANGRAIVQKRPVVYQDGASIEGRYKVKHGRVTFELARYDHTKKLVIDPAVTFATYLGGSDVDRPNSIAADTQGAIYVVGGTASTNFPTAQPVVQGTTGGGSNDGFVTKYNSLGARVFSTYIGGSDSDSVATVAVDTSNSVYVGGSTRSTNFPVKTPYQSALKPGAAAAWVGKLNSSGETFFWATYLGGTTGERVTGIAVDSSNNVYVSGATASADFPVTSNAAQKTFGGGQDFFVTKFNTNGTSLLYSTYLGGTGNDEGNAIGLDTAGNIYIAGGCDTGFPTKSAFQSTYKGGGSDGCVAKFNSGGVLQYSTFIGGTGNDTITGMAVDSNGNAFVSGSTFGNDYPTKAAYQSTLKGSSDGTLAKFDTSGALVFSTFIGGTGTEASFAVAVGVSGNIYVTGQSGSTDYPTLSPTQAANAGGQEAVVSVFDSTGAKLLFSTYYGGSGVDAGVAIAVDPQENIYVTGSTSSTNLATVSPVQAVSGGNVDAFVLRFGSLTIGASLPPTVPQNGVVDAAAYVTSVVGGGIASVFGGNLAPSPMFAPAVPLATTLNGTTVKVGGITVALFYVSPSQINFQLPWSFGPTSGPSTLTVTTAGGTSASVPVFFVSGAPEIFTIASDGKVGPGVVTIAATGELAQPVGSVPGRAARPAKAGEFITIYFEGGGPVTPTVANAVASGGSPASTCTNKSSVTFNGAGFVLADFCGLTPGSVSLYQINVQVPAGAFTRDNQIISISFSGSGGSSNQVTIATVAGN